MQHADYPPDVWARFWMKAKVVPSGCWEWQASKRGGYGQFGLAQGDIRPAHRMAYEMLRGPIPQGLVLDHLCRNPCCVNPSHLEPVTRGENVMRGVGVSVVNAAKEHCVNGHRLAGENLYVHPRTGKRQCRICRTVKMREYKQRRRQRSAQDA